MSDFPSDKKFIDEWNNATKTAHVAQLFGYKNVDTVRHRATRLRQRGHYLKNMRHEFDVESMIEVAKGNYEVGPKEFIIIWQNCSSAKQVAKITGLNYEAVRARAREYRKMGIPMKMFKRKKSMIGAKEAQLYYEQ